MTREEAIICLKGIKNYGRDTFNEQTDWQGCLDMAIEALEQEPFMNKSCVSNEVCEHDKMQVLDKIMVEIESAYEDLDGYDPEALPTYICRVKDIIDKYRKVGE